MTDLDHNLRAVAPYLERYRNHVTGHFINGKTVVPPGAATFDNLSPVDNATLGAVVRGTTADVDAACAAAAAAFPAWRDTSGAERRKRVDRVVVYVAAPATRFKDRSPRKLIVLVPEHAPMCALARRRPAGPERPQQTVRSAGAKTVELRRGSRLVRTPTVQFRICPVAQTIKQDNDDRFHPETP